MRGAFAPLRRRKNSGLGRLRRLNRRTSPQRALTFPREICVDKCVALLNASFCGSCCGRHKNSWRRSRPSGVYTDLNCGAPFTLSHPLPATRKIRDSDEKQFDRDECDFKIEKLTKHIACFIFQNRNIFFYKITGPSWNSLTKRRTRRELSRNGGNY